MPLLFRQDDQLLRGVLEDQIRVRWLGEEHWEGELVRHLLPVKLLRVFHEVDEGIDLLLTEGRGGDDGVGLDLAQIAALVVSGRSSGSISAEELKIGRQLIPGPPFFPFSVAVLHHRRVLDESHVASSLNETPKGSGVAEIIFHVVAVAVTAGSAVTQVTEMAVLPVIFLLLHTIKNN